MSNFINFIKNVCTKNFGKIGLLSLVATFNTPEKFSINLIALLILLIIIKEVIYRKSKSVSKIIVEEPVINEPVNEPIIEPVVEPAVNIKENIKLIYERLNKNKKEHKEPYINNKNTIEKNYNDEKNSNEFVVNVNSNTCSIPIFNLRTFNDIDYYFNFIIHNFDPKKINNLIMHKDIHKWISTSSLTDEDLSDEVIPIYFIKKDDKINDRISVYEYLKIFIHTGEDGIKNALVQKGSDYLLIEQDINELLSKGLIKNLLESKEYINYNLSINLGVTNFLDKILSLVLIPEQFIGENVSLDIKNYIENKQTYEYYFNTVNAELNAFNTTL